MWVAGALARAGRSLAVALSQATNNIDVSESRRRDRRDNARILSS
jgi:hypothetical protein